MNIPAQTPSDSLSPDQAAGIEKVYDFLLSDERVLSLSGPAGTGKTYLTEKIITDIVPLVESMIGLLEGGTPHFRIVLAATTHKAAMALRKATGKEVRTIHSLLGLKVETDYRTDTAKLVYEGGNTIYADLGDTVEYEIGPGTIAIIDEASMIGQELYDWIDQLIHPDAKIIYVGDHAQLPPINEAISPVYRKHPIDINLTTQMRSSGQPALTALNQQLREIVLTGNFTPIVEVPGVIDFLDDHQAMATVDALFKQEGGDARILTFTNAKMAEYTDYIRQLRGYKAPFEVGEHLTLTTNLGGKDSATFNESEWVVCAVGNKEKVQLSFGSQRVHAYQFRAKNLTGNLHAHHDRIFSVPLYPQRLRDVRKTLYREKSYQALNTMRNKLASFRRTDVSTIHKAQGSTHEAVFIDVGDMHKCRDLDTLARLMFVATSRARSRVYLYGNLPAVYQ